MKKILIPIFVLSMIVLSYLFRVKPDHPFSSAKHLFQYATVIEADNVVGCDMLNNAKIIERCVLHKNIDTTKLAAGLLANGWFYSNGTNYGGRLEISLCRNDENIFFGNGEYGPEIVYKQGAVSTYSCKPK